MLANAEVWPVVQARAPEFPVIDAEAQRMHQMKLAGGAGAEPCNIAGIRWNLRLVQDDVQGRVHAPAR